MAPSLVTRRRRPFDPLTLAGIFGVNGGSMADQLDDDTKRQLVETLARPQPVVDAPPVAVRPAIVPPPVTTEQPAILPPTAQAIAPAVMPAVPVDYDAPVPPMSVRPPLPPDDLGASLARQLPQAVPTGEAPPMALTRGGRPARVFIGDGGPEDREAAYADKVRGFQPQKESKKHLALRTLLGFLGGGLVGRGGVAETLLGPGGVMDRRGLDRQWQQNELAQATANLGGYRDERRQGLQDRLLGAQVNRLENPLPPAPVDRTVGGNILRRQPDGSYKTVYDGPDKPETQRPPLMRTRQNRDGTTSTLISRDNGQTWQDAPDLTSTPPPKTPTGQETPQQRSERVRKFRAAKITFDDYVAGENRAAKVKDDAYARASTLKAWKAEGRNKDGKVSTAGFSDIDSDDIKAAEEAAQKAQAAYESYAEKKTKAQADMLQYGEVGEDGQAREPQQGSGLNTTEQKIYDAAVKARASGKNIDPDEAVRRYRSGKY